MRSQRVRHDWVTSLPFFLKALEQRRLEKEGISTLASVVLLQDTDPKRPAPRQREYLRGSSGDLVRGFATIGRWKYDHYKSISEGMQGIREHLISNNFVPVFSITLWNSYWLTSSCHRGEPGVQRGWVTYPRTRGGCLAKLDLGPMSFLL